MGEGESRYKLHSPYNEASSRYGVPFVADIFNNVSQSSLKVSKGTKDFTSHGKSVLFFPTVLEKVFLNIIYTMHNTALKLYFLIGLLATINRRMIKCSQLLCLLW